MTGSKGEMIAAEYLSAQFRELKLTRLFIDTVSEFFSEFWPSYKQRFRFLRGRELGDSNFVRISGMTLTDSYKPMEYSASKSVSGRLHQLNEITQDVSEAIVFTPWFESDPHSQDALTPRELASDLAQKGALAVIFTCDSSGTPYQPNYSLRVTSLPIPVLSDQCKSVIELRPDVGASVSVDLVEVRGMGHNVASYINHKAAHTVIIGAHYDHLGWGEHGSLYRGESAIHNGADDNASGVAMVLELAKELRKKKYKKYNYLMVAFSGEELGLYGSTHFVNNLPIKPNNISFTLNFDMVGRYDSSRGLAINGVGTSSVWPDVIKGISTEMKIVTSESGIGPSDHTPFYLKNIPVLHFFTGAHEDYHKPTDVADKINYDGMMMIKDFVLRLIKATDATDTLPFTKTQDSGGMNAPRFTVTLGVVPDYLFDGVGMRISGVSDGKPASVAGLKEGDVIIKLGDFAVSDMMTYMEALSRFRKGDTATVIAKRGNDELPFMVTF